MEMETLRRSIQRLDGISSPSASLDRILELAANSESDVDELIAAIERDPAVTSRVLRLSNSAYFGMAGRVDTLSRAVVVIGWQNVLSLATCAALAPFFRGGDPRLDRPALWLHSCATAEAARVIASHTRFDPSVAHVAGLLHELGAVVLADVPGCDYAAVLDARDRGLTLCDAERAVLGVDHGWAAGVLFEQWALPADLCQAVALHHAPEAESSGLASLVALADWIACEAGFPGPSRRPTREAPDPLWLDALGLKAPQLEELADEVEARRGLIELGAGGPS